MGAEAEMQLQIPEQTGTMKLKPQKVIRKVRLPVQAPAAQA
jgi:hypothetical protein